MIKRHQTTIALLAICIAAGSGCATDTRKIPHTVGTTSHSEAPRTPPLRTTVEQAKTPPTADAAREPLQPTDQLDLSQALQLALTRNPSLNAQAHRIQASQALVRQAGFLPNPTIKVEVEEYDRAGAGFDSAETAISLSQEIELGGKRRWRTRQAELDAKLTQWQYESARLDVITETRQRTVALIAAQERLALAHSAVELAESMQRTVQERVSAGKEPALQATKATTTLAMTRLDEASAHDQLAAARSGLAKMWGANQPHFKNMTGDLSHIPDGLPKLAALRHHLGANPELARMNTEQEQQEANLAAAKAARIPNVNASIAMQNYEEDDTDALAFGIGVPLPLFNRNQGNIAAARHAMAGMAAERQATENRLAADLAEAYAQLNSSHRRARTLTTMVIPVMQEAFNAARDGYQQGKFDFLDLLDAQRTLQRITGERIDALEALHMAIINVERTTATPIEKMSTQEEKAQ
jgi:cobalt-zinc-cadmium efflux system outer membrane protein